MSVSLTDKANLPLSESTRDGPTDIELSPDSLHFVEVLSPSSTRLLTTVGLKIHESAPSSTVFGVVRIFREPDKLAPVFSMS